VRLASLAAESEHSVQEMVRGRMNCIYCGEAIGGSDELIFQQGFVCGDGNAYDFMRFSSTKEGRDIKWLIFCVLMFKHYYPIIKSL